ncbi:hypothetical protein [Sulfurovum sp. TSL1]|uniref:hypothetical protein n=1 Tax=Sulfurovum sp. TSL1 TaxID=2826994 RepID=UPI001CC7BF1F|nr:hypothetical protein [Sulfurovum sp. TSL1]
MRYCIKFSDSEQIFQNSLSRMAKLDRKSLSDLSASLFRAEVRGIKGQLLWKIEALLCHTSMRIN